MGLGDKFKNLARQAQDSVAEHKDQLQGAVEAVGVAADRKTKGRHSDKIARMGQKASDALDRLGDDDAAAETGPAGPDATASGPDAAAPGPDATAPGESSAGEHGLG